MVPLTELVNVLMRWAHIASAATLVGGVLFARTVAAPALDRDPEMLERLARRFRHLLYAGVVGLLVSGVFNLLTNKGHTPYYHAWFGIKFLLALHVFAGALLAVRSGPATPEAADKRLRRLSGVIISGFIILLISAYLRRIY